ncbi:putative cyclopropane-fatty-acyl-phospholipid synthase [Helianthus annuus]|nr:putative cyclopropane-fatty-acyl-phospholipid synthase [Helianthus annuus]
MKVAVVGAGISGLVSAYVLAKSGAEVILYEKQGHLGGHAKTVLVDGIDLDLGFMVFNGVTSPNMMELFKTLEVDMEVSDMSFSVSLDDGHGYEWGTRNGLSSLFSQKKNLLNPRFWNMMFWEVTKFKTDALRYLEDNQDTSHRETLQGFIKSHGYSESFQKAYLVPMCYSIWPYPAEQILDFSAFLVLSSLRSQHMLQVFGRPQWIMVRSRSRTFVTKVKEDLERKGCQIRIGCGVQSVSKFESGWVISCEDGSQEKFSGCIIATHAPDALTLLGEQASYEEKTILGAFNYVYSDMFLHRDAKLMPRNQTTWSAWNFRETVDNKVCLTYWLNAIQNIDDKGLPFLVTINPPQTPESTVLKWSTGYPVPSLAASKASLELHTIQGKRNIVFCGAYQGYGFNEDGVKAGIVAANTMLNKSYDILNNPNQMVPTFMEANARSLIVKFLRNYITLGTLILIEEGGTVFKFEGSKKKSSLKVHLKVHSPQLYWKLATKGGIGLAEAYINGDFSVIDENDRVLNLLLLLSPRFRERKWWTPIFKTATAKYFYHQVMRKNTITQARNNISAHYDLSNEHFSLFLDETMTYSCAIFKSEDEDLKTAQLRKLHSLIEKARVEKHHEVLDIGCGWGSLAIELVKKTGCKYTGITLSKEQIEYAERKVKEANLQDRIKFLLRDYRQIPDAFKYDRIISCEAIEHFGHEYYEEFFGCCESALVEDGIFVLQTIAVQDRRYDEFRKRRDFIKEYIFPGGNLPSLSRLISAMSASSKLCVDHVEQIDRLNYYQTLRCWRANFMKNQSKILALGFNQDFIRTWEYYFDYCAAGFKIGIVLDYQVVFSRPGKR